MSELVITYNQLKLATCPEDVFGMLAFRSELKEGFRMFVKTCHPDYYPVEKDKKIAEEAFKWYGIVWAEVG